MSEDLLHVASPKLCLVGRLWSDKLDTLDCRLLVGIRSPKAYRDVCDQSI